MESASTVEKAMDLLFLLHGKGEPMGVSGLGRELGLPKSSAHRLLRALARRELVEQDERGRYRPGIGLIALGLGTLRSDPLVLASRPVLEAESRAIGETAFLVAARNSELIVLDKAEGTGFLRAAPTLGSRVPHHCTAVGKLYRAFADEVHPLPEPLEAYTEHTLTDAAGLAVEIEATRARGFALNREEWIPGLGVVAAPLFSGPQFRGAIAIAAPIRQLETLGLEHVGNRTCRAAETISQRLGSVSSARRSPPDRSADGPSSSEVHSDRSHPTEPPRQRKGMA